MLGCWHSGSDDAVGRLFAKLEEDGEDIAISYGQVAGADVRWHTRSHARYDGIAGFEDVVRSVGGRVISDPPVPVSGPPRSMGALCRLARLWRRPSARWRQLPVEGAPQLVIRGRRPARAIAVLGADGVTTLRSSVRANGQSVGGYLLGCLHAALVPFFSTDIAAIWVVPVNLRGSVTRRRSSSNQISFVPVRLRASDGPTEASRRLRSRLEDGSHWAIYAAAHAAAAFDGATPSVAALADAFRGRSVGLFSNLGAWEVYGLSEPTRWVFGPPVARFLPLSAGAVTVNGSLGLMLQAYPSLTLDDDEVRAWLNAWIGQVENRIGAASGSISRRNVQSLR